MSAPAASSPRTSSLADATTVGRCRHRALQNAQLDGRSCGAANGCSRFLVFVEVQGRCRLLPSGQLFLGVFRVVPVVPVFLLVAHLGFNLGAFFLAAKRDRDSYKEGAAKQGR